MPAVVSVSNGCNILRLSSSPCSNTFLNPFLFDWETFSILCVQAEFVFACVQCDFGLLVATVDDAFQIFGRKFVFARKIAVDVVQVPNFGNLLANSGRCRRTLFVIVVDKALTHITRNTPINPLTRLNADNSYE